MSPDPEGGDKISKNIIFLSLTINFALANSADPDEMPHFIWVLTVCQSTRFGVPSLQMVIIIIIIIIIIILYPY